MAYGTVNADVIGTSVANTSLGAGNASIMKNRILNGSMVIDQRNAGLAVNLNSANIYTVDRFKSYAAGSWGSGVFSAQQNKGSVTPPAGYINYIGIATTTADSTLSTSITYDFGQNIEGLNCTDLGWGTANAKTVTLSFQVYSNLTGTFGGTIINSAENRCYVFSYTISSANTWTPISVTIAGDTSGTWLTTNGVGIKVNFSLGSASNKLTTAGSWNSSLYSGVTGQQNICVSTANYIYITGVQLEVGSSATGYEYRQYQQELALCQRYYYRFTNSSGTAAYLLNSQAYSSSAVFGKMFDLPVTMRATPTGTLSAIGSINPTSSAGSGTSVFTGGAIDWNTTNSLGTSGLTGSSGLTAGNCSVVSILNNGWIAGSAEL
jgi:hypothetical protein